MLRLWREALTEAQHSALVRAIVITGAGKDFCAGGDIENMRKRIDEPAIQKKTFLAEEIQTIPLIMSAIDKPIIAAINGAATGAGMDMALMCDIRFAEQRTRMAERYISVGIVPGAGGAWILPRMIGTARALELLWTGRWVNANEALSLGLVNRVVEDGNVVVEALEFAHGLTKAPPITISYIKRSVQQSITMDLRTHLDMLSSHMAVVNSTHDYREGLHALAEGRAPEFTGK